MTTEPIQSLIDSTPGLFPGPMLETGAQLKPVALEKAKDAIDTFSLASAMNPHHERDLTWAVFQDFPSDSNEHNWILCARFRLQFDAEHFIKACPATSKHPFKILNVKSK